MEKEKTKHTKLLKENMKKESGRNLLVFQNTYEDKGLFLSVFDNKAESLLPGKTYEFSTVKSSNGKWNNLSGPIVECLTLKTQTNDVDRPLFPSNNHPTQVSKRNAFKHECLMVSATSIRASFDNDEEYADKLYKRARIIYERGVGTGYLEWLSQ